MSKKPFSSSSPSLSSPSSSSSPSEVVHDHLRKSLSPFDGICVILSIMIGSGIFASPGKQNDNKYFFLLTLTLTSISFDRNCSSKSWFSWCCYSCLVMFWFISYISIFLLFRIRNNVSYR